MERPDESGLRSNTTGDGGVRFSDPAEGAKSRVVLFKLDPAEGAKSWEPDEVASPLPEGVIGDG